MTNSDTNPLADSLVYEDLIPLAWAAIEGDFKAINLSRLAEHNEHVLRYAGMLAEQIRDKADEESETDTALLRLDAKVNLLLEMLANLDRHKRNIPDATQVRLSAAGVEWRGQGAMPAEGDRVWVDLYIDDRIPEAIRLPALVLRVSEEGSDTLICARFEEIGEPVRDRLEKMIFRHHRRLVAQSRSG